MSRHNQLDVAVRNGSSTWIQVSYLYYKLYTMVAKRIHGGEPEWKSTEV